MKRWMQLSWDRNKVSTTFGTPSDRQGAYEGGARYLRYLLNLYRGNLSLALAAYNAGEGAVAKYNYNIPPYRETQTYVKRVLAFYETYSRS